MATTPSAIAGRRPSPIARRRRPYRDRPGGGSNNSSSSSNDGDNDGLGGIVPLSPYPVQRRWLPPPASPAAHRPSSPAVARSSNTTSGSSTSSSSNDNDNDGLGGIVPLSL